MTTDLERHRPEFCLILFGTNNAKGSQKAIDAAVEDIRKMTELAAERGVIPIVGTIPPRGFKDEHSVPEASFNAALIAMSVVAKVPVADIFEAIQRRPNRREVIASDGIHWARTGFEIPARVWANAMDKVRFVLDDNP
jgi:lysophospholipase L1-like esterase